MYLARRETGKSIKLYEIDAYEQEERITRTGQVRMTTVPRKEWSWEFHAGSGGFSSIGDTKERAISLLQGK